MLEKYKDFEGINETFVFLKMDVFDLKYDDQSFNYVIDKGTLDAI
jgi:hypothetical protein